MTTFLFHVHPSVMAPYNFQHVVWWIFGDNVEDLLGHKKFLAFYFICGIGSSIAHVIIHTHSALPMVGASGAVSGVLGAYALSFPKALILTYFGFWPSQVRSYVFLIFWFGVAVASGSPRV